MTQVEHMPGSDKAHTDHGEHRLFCPMPDSQSTTHEGKACHRNDERPRAPMTDCANADRNSSHQRGEQKTDTMDGRIEQEGCAKAKPGD